MRHIRTLKYKGHEITIIKNFETYIAGVREDNFDGATTASWNCMVSEKEAVLTAKSFIDELHNQLKE